MGSIGNLNVLISEIFEIVSMRISSWTFEWLGTPPSENILILVILSFPFYLNGMFLFSHLVVLTETSHFICKQIKGLVTK